MLKIMPTEGQRVRVTRFGDDYGRIGEVKFTLQGRIWVDFGDWDDRFTAEELEVIRGTQAA
jgi:hypothetical protein